MFSPLLLECMHRSFFCILGSLFSPSISFWRQYFLMPCYGHYFALEFPQFAAIWNYDPWLLNEENSELCNICLKSITYLPLLKFVLLKLWCVFLTMPLKLFFQSDFYIFSDFDISYQNYLNTLKKHQFGVFSDNKYS